MGRYDNTKRNQYNSTPRKVFDTYIDRMAVKRQRDRDDHRADMAALIKRLNNLESLVNAQSKKHCCTDPTCKFCTDDWDSHCDREGLE